MNKRNQRGQAAAITLGIIAVIVVTVGLLFVTGTIGNLYSSTVERKALSIDAENKRHGYEYQSSTQDAVARKIPEWSGLEPGSPHEIALRNEICRLAGTLDNPDQQTITYTQENCP